MGDSPFFNYGPARIAVSTDDWSKADGAMLTEDDEVVPMMDLSQVTSIEFTTHPLDGA